MITEAWYKILKVKAVGPERRGFASYSSTHALVKVEDGAVRVIPKQLGHLRAVEDRGGWRPKVPRMLKKTPTPRPGDVPQDKQHPQG